MAPEMEHGPAAPRRIGRMLFAAAIACSLAALALVLGNLAAGVAPQPDEGTAAHLFQLLIAAQLPLAAAFAATADWRAPARPALALAAQAAALAAALGALYWSGY